MKGRHGHSDAERKPRDLSKPCSSRHFLTEKRDSGNRWGLVFCGWGLLAKAAACRGQGGRPGRSRSLLHIRKICSLQEHRYHGLQRGKAFPFAGKSCIIRAGHRKGAARSCHKPILCGSLPGSTVIFLPNSACPGKAAWWTRWNPPSFLSRSSETPTPCGDWRVFPICGWSGSSTRRSGKPGLPPSARPAWAATSAWACSPPVRPSAPIPSPCPA